MEELKTKSIRTITSPSTRTIFYISDGMVNVNLRYSTVVLGDECESVLSRVLETRRPDLLILLTGTYSLNLWHTVYGLFL